jgi:mRNA interferase HigB
MRVIAKKRLMDLAAQYPNSRPSVQAWHQIVANTDYDSFDQLRQTFPKADMVGRYVIFNINGNHFRLITVIHFNRRIIYIRALLTQAGYDKIDFDQEDI